VKKVRGFFHCFDCNVVAKTWNLSSTGSDVTMDQRRYIDPGNYLDIMELLSTFTSEIERSKTKLDGLIGQGNWHVFLTSKKSVSLQKHRAFDDALTLIWRLVIPPGFFLLPRAFLH